MKTNRNLKLNRSLAAVVAGFALFTGVSHAAPFLYSPGDLVVAFRRAGAESDYVVNLGKATNFNNLPPGTTIPIANVDPAILEGAIPTVNSLKWIVGAANRPPLNANYPEHTLWVSRPRQNPNVQSAPWLRLQSAAQGNAGSYISAVGARARDASSSVVPGGPNNTAVAVVVPTDITELLQIGKVIGSSGNYVGNWGVAENVTPSTFSSDPANVSRSDLYEVLPGNGVDQYGRYLGYFELKPDRTLTFNTLVAAPPSPTITSTVRNGDVTTVSFTTTSGATYRLRSTSAAGLTSPVSTWAIGASIPGTGSVQSLSDTNTADIRFFAVDAQ